MTNLQQLLNREMNLNEQIAFVEELQAELPRLTLSQNEPERLAETTEELQAVRRRSQLDSLHGYLRAELREVEKDIAAQQ